MGSVLAKNMFLPSPLIYSNLSSLKSQNSFTIHWQAQNGRNCNVIKLLRRIQKHFLKLYLSR